MAEIMSTTKFGKELMMRYEALLYELLPLQDRLESLHEELDRIWDMMEVMGVTPEKKYFFYSRNAQELNN